MAIMMGLNKANSIYACIWCTVPKDERCSFINYIHQLLYIIIHRWDSRVPERKYNLLPPEGKMRSLASLQRNCSFSQPQKHLGSKNPPLLNLEPSKYVVDELHLLLRVSDILLRNLIHLADHLQQQTQQRRGAAGTQIQQLQEMVRSCGVPFRISRVIHEHSSA